MFSGVLDPAPIQAIAGGNGQHIAGRLYPGVPSVQGNTEKGCEAQLHRTRPSITSLDLYGYMTQLLLLLFSESVTI